MRSQSVSVCIAAAGNAGLPNGPAHCVLSITGVNDTFLLSEAWVEGKCRANPPGKPGHRVSEKVPRKSGGFGE